MTTSQQRQHERAERISDTIVRAYTRGEPDLIDEVFTDDFVAHMTGDVDVTGPEAYKDRIRSICAAFPDFWKEEVFLAAEDDHVAVRYRWGGTHEGEFAGIPATGKRVETTSAALLRLEGDRVAEMWVYSDGETLKQQLEAEA
jgi:steroid delta-isomerase-like uncharacterized protein